MSRDSPDRQALASQREYDRRMNRVLDYIDRNLDTPMELAAGRSGPFLALSFPPPVRGLDGCPLFAHSAGDAAKDPDTGRFRCGLCITARPL